MKKAAAICALVLAITWLGAGCKKTPQASTEAGKAPPPVAESQATPDPGPSATPAAINRNAQVIVLGYHRVVDQVRRPDTEISKTDFEAQMQQLKDQGITVIPLHDLLAWKRGEKDIPPKSAVITMDDGWKSQYENAWPILQKFGYPFTLFVYTDYVKGGPKSGGQSITWEQIAEMRDAGADIGGHTVSHKDLRGKKSGNPPEYEAWLWKELADSKQMIEQKLGVKVEALAVPFGFYNAHVQEVAKKAGYDAIFTVYGQKIGFGSPNLALGRFMIEPTKPKVFASAINFGTGGPRTAAEPVAEFAPHSLDTQPANDTTVTDPRPLIQANLSEFGDVNPGSLSMRISSLGAVDAKFDPSTKTYTYQPQRNLPDNRYTVIVTGKAKNKRVEARWEFGVDTKTKAEQKTEQKP